MSNRYFITKTEYDDKVLSDLINQVEEAYERIEEKYSIKNAVKLQVKVHALLDKLKEDYLIDE